MEEEPVYVYDFGNEDIGDYTIAVQRNNSIQIKDQFGLNIVLLIDQNIEYEVIEENTYSILGRNMGINNIIIKNLLTIQTHGHRATIDFGLEINQILQDGSVRVEVAREAVETLREIAIALQNGDDMPFGHQPLAEEINAPPAGVGNINIMNEEQEGGTRYRRKRKGSKTRKTRKLKRKGLKK
jgi:hypothetical protein